MRRQVGMKASLQCTPQTVSLNAEAHLLQEGSPFLIGDISHPSSVPDRPTPPTDTSFAKASFPKGYLFQIHIKAPRGWLPKIFFLYLQELSV
jgi:hypothetical protein